MPDIICRRQRTKNLLVVACGGRRQTNGKLVNNYTNRIMKFKPEEEVGEEVEWESQERARYARKRMSYISIACGPAVASARFAQTETGKLISRLQVAVCRLLSVAGYGLRLRFKHGPQLVWCQPICSFCSLSLLSSLRAFLLEMKTLNRC